MGDEVGLYNLPVVLPGNSALGGRSQYRDAICMSGTRAGPTSLEKEALEMAWEKEEVGDGLYGEGPRERSIWERRGRSGGAGHRGAVGDESGPGHGSDVGDESGRGHEGDVGGLGPSALEEGPKKLRARRDQDWQREAERESRQAEGCEKGREDSVGMDEWGNVGGLLLANKVDLCLTWYGLLESAVGKLSGDLFLPPRNEGAVSRVPWCPAGPLLSAQGLGCCRSLPAPVRSTCCSRAHACFLTMI